MKKENDYMYVPEKYYNEKHDFGKSKISELEKEIERLKHVAEELVVFAFSISELRDIWRERFGIPGKCVDDGGMS